MLRKEYYGYTVDFSEGVRAASQTPVNVAIDKDSDFELIMCTRALTLDLTAAINAGDVIMGQQVPSFRVWIYDTGRGAYLTDKPVSLVNMFGTAQYPAILAEPLLVLAGSGLNFTLFNDYTSLDIDFLQLTLIGRKVSSGKKVLGASNV